MDRQLKLDKLGSFIASHGAEHGLISQQEMATALRSTLRDTSHGLHAAVIPAPL